MKKKVRKIVVNDTEYGWNVVGVSTFRIWKDKKIVHEDTFREKISPKDIKNIIEKEDL